MGCLKSFSLRVKLDRVGLTHFGCLKFYINEQTTNLKTMI